jgi:hypothetical protein
MRELKVMSTKFIVLAFTLFIYILIIIAFQKAKVKYSGGKIGDVINLILITAILLFVSDCVLLLRDYFAENITFMIQTLLRTTALSFLAYGGSRVASK